MKYSLFSYKGGSSFLHKCPAWCKILFIPLINILFLCLPPVFAISLIGIQFVFACILRFTIKEQLADLKPVIYYGILLLFVKIIGVVFSVINGYFGTGEEIVAQQSFLEVLKQICLAEFTWEKEKATVLMLIKLFCVMQSASLLFKTSTSLELREGISTIEGRIRKIFHLKNENKLTDVISLFLNFIPMVSKIWEQSKKAWIARGGKNNLKMYATLLPVLFSVGMKKAYNSARSISIRK